MNTVVHLESSDVFKKIVRERFTHHGWEYRNARTEVEAIDLLNCPNVKMIITALEVGEGSGEEFIARIAASSQQGIPVVVMSSNESIELRTRLYGAGIRDFIPKKLDMETMAGYLDRLIRDDEVSLRLQDLKIAVLDDSDVQIKFIRSVFESRSIANVACFMHPADLLKQDEEFQVYLIDIVLPGKSGDQVIYELRGKYRNSVIIAMSTIDHFNTVSSVLHSGADDYLLKPLNENVFIARLKSNVRTYFLLKELEEKNRALADMAVHDGLTQLYNHRYLYERLDIEIAKAKRYSRPLSIIMFDIDHFKRINDKLGHRMGDAVLAEVAGVIGGSVRDTDVLGRYGGEEFLAILPESDLNAAMIMAERIRRETESLSFPESLLSVTMSAGVVELKDENAQGLVERADKCLYRAKDEGRNRVVRGE